MVQVTSCISFNFPLGRAFFVVPFSWLLPSRYVPLTSFSTVPACIICLRHYRAFSSRLLCSLHPRFDFDRPIEPLDTTRCLQQILSCPICKLATNQHNLHCDRYVRCIVVNFRLANGAKSKIIRLIVIIIHTNQAVHWSNTAWKRSRDQETDLLEDTDSDD